MRRLVMTTASLWMVLVLFPVMALAQKPAYIGVNKCKGCHMGASKGDVNAKWRPWKYVQAFEALKANSQERNPKSLPCHNTGYYEGGYKMGAPNASKFEGVHCETCLGVGSLYLEIVHMKDMGKAMKKDYFCP